MEDEYYVDGRASRPRPTLLASENLAFLTVLIKTAGDDLIKKYIITMCHERDPSVVNTLCLILLPVEHCNGGLLTFPTPPPNVYDGVVETTQFGVMIEFCYYDRCISRYLSFQAFVWSSLATTGWVQEPATMRKSTSQPINRSTNK